MIISTCYQVLPTLILSDSCHRVKLCIPEGFPVNNNNEDNNNFLLTTEIGGSRGVFGILAAIYQDQARSRAKVIALLIFDAPFTLTAVHQRRTSTDATLRRHDEARASDLKKEKCRVTNVFDLTDTSDRKIGSCLANLPVRYFGRRGGQTPRGPRCERIRVTLFSTTRKGAAFDFSRPPATCRGNRPI